MRLRVWCVSLLGLAACRSTAPLVRTVPVVAPGPAAASAVTIGADTGKARRDSALAVLDTLRLPGAEDITRAIAGMFGDSLLLARAPGAARPPSGRTTADTTDGADEDSDAPRWDIDVRSYETHSRVAHYVKLFTETGKARFEARLSRGTRYEAMIRAKLRAAGMPEDLYFLPLIESGYDPHAYSRAAAVGMWQFMSSTGRDVGLRIDWWVDERRDPVRSTDAAIRFLRDLQEQFGSLYLAAAAYNGGPGRVSRGLKQFADELEGAEGEDRFFALAEQSYLRDETKNYVPQIIAAALAAKSPQRFGMSVDTLPPLRYDSLWVSAGVPLAAVARAADAPPSALADLNPHILRGTTPPTSAMWVRIPPGAPEQVAARLQGMPASERTAFSTAVTRNRETLGALATRLGVSSRAVQQFNPGLRTARRGRLVAGQTVRVPTAATLAAFRDVPDPSIERYGGVTRGGGRAAPSRMHIVRRGESLGRIASRYGLTVGRLKALNGLRRDRVYAGQALVVRAGASSSSRAASGTARRSPSAKPSRAAAGASKARAKAGVAKARRAQATKRASSGTAKRKGSAAASTSGKRSGAKPGATRPKR